MKDASTSQSLNPALAGLNIPGLKDLSSRVHSENEEGASYEFEAPLEIRAKLWPLCLSHPEYFLNLLAGHEECMVVMPNGRIIMGANNFRMNFDIASAFANQYHGVCFPQIKGATWGNSFKFDDFVRAMKMLAPNWKGSDYSQGKVLAEQFANGKAFACLDEEVKYFGDVQIMGIRGSLMQSISGTVMADEINPLRNLGVTVEERRNYSVNLELALNGWGHYHTQVSGKKLSTEMHFQRKVGEHSPMNRILWQFMGKIAENGFRWEMGKDESYRKLNLELISPRGTNERLEEPVEITTDLLSKFCGVANKLYDAVRKYDTLQERREVEEAEVMAINIGLA